MFNSKNYNVKFFLVISTYFCREPKRSFYLTKLNSPFDLFTYFDFINSFYIPQISNFRRSELGMISKNLVQHYSVLKFYDKDSQSNTCLHCI